MTTYKIGTRGSLLAVTQSTLMKNQLEAMSGEKFELVLIKTQGDEITNKPLWQLEGKDFFTKELDEALLKGDVDFVIHSYKDLGSERPKGIKLAAVTERRFAHDILLIPQSNIEKLKNWSGDFIVGTSSPRRIANLTHALPNYLPYINSIKCETLRGNVNSRIRKLKDGQYHAITLALAGLERLAHGEKSKAELTELLTGMNYLILPQSVFPSAASQGALGIEMREDRDDNGKLAKILGGLAHERTIEEVQRERKAFKDYGGGCHLAVGIHVKKIGEDFLHVHSGEVDSVRIEKKWMEGILPPKKAHGKKLFVGLPKGDRAEVVYDEYLKKVPVEETHDFTHKHVFVTSRYCLPTLKKSSKPRGLWAAGSKTAGRLIADGFWINGTSDSLGTVDLMELKASKALQIITPEIASNWATLTHKEGSTDLGDVIGCYTREAQKISTAYHDSLHEVGACFWTSYAQFQNFIAEFPILANAIHCCGIGKTWQEFNKAGIKVNPMARMEDFYQL